MDKKSALEALRHFRFALESKGIRIHKFDIIWFLCPGGRQGGKRYRCHCFIRFLMPKELLRIDILSDAIYEVFEP